MCDLDQLANWVRRNLLDLSPKYQRGYVWKPDRASRLVVTALCNRIIPGVVLHEVSKGSYEVVDGKQRLTTLLGFYLAGEDPEQYKKLCIKHERYHQSPELFTTLQKLDEQYAHLQGLTYSQLTPERQRAFQSYTIPCTIIPLGTPKDEVFSCYEDINSGGENLTPQQLRRAVYFGEYIDLLDCLADNPDFQCIRDPKRFHAGSYQLCPKESDRELILRALAWSRGPLNYKKALKTFFNAELQQYDALKEGGSPEHCQSEFLQSRQDEFEFIMKVWRNVFSEDDGAFRVWNGQEWSKDIYVGLWDAMYAALAELRHQYSTESIYMQRKEALKHTIQKLFESGELEINSRLTKVTFFQRRDKIKNTLASVLQTEKPASRRDFAEKEDLKRKLHFLQEGKCTICGNDIDGRRLDEGRYVHIDHVVPYSKGGESSAANAALTHAACNLSKGAKTTEAYNAYRYVSEESN